MDPTGSRGWPLITSAIKGFRKFLRGLGDVRCRVLVVVCIKLESIRERRRAKRGVIIYITIIVVHISSKSPHYHHHKLKWNKNGTLCTHVCSSRYKYGTTLDERLGQGGGIGRVGWVLVGVAIIGLLDGSWNV